MNVLMIGSGVSANEVRKWDLDGQIIIAINNAWKIVPNRYDVWIRPSDFPRENYPTKPKGEKQLWIGHQDYKHSVRHFYHKYGWFMTEYKDVKATLKPEFCAGYTTFFQAFYWVLHNICPENIGFIGCEHIYDKKAVDLWIKGGQVGPQNNWKNNLKGEVGEWANEYFKDCKPTHFYGHGSPDPMRLGIPLMMYFFKQAWHVAIKENCNLYNYGSKGGLMPYPVKIIGVPRET